MLNDSRVLGYVKHNLGFPFMHLELEDEQILEYIKLYSLREFSYYVPDVKTMSLNVQLEANKVPGKGNEFYLNEPDGREIINVSNIYFDQSDLYALGHPPFGAFTMGELPEWALAVNNAMTTKMFSSYDKTFEFKHPNIVRISPMNFQMKFVTVEYERIQSEDFSEVPNDIQVLFEELALADIMIVLGRIRKKYAGGNLKTPFGEIPLESDIFEEGQTKKREVVEKLERLFIPNVRIVHG
jgi:hypothetical protein